MMERVSESTFRRRLENLLNGYKRGFAIPPGADPWGMTIKRPTMPGVLMWYDAGDGILTLGLTTDYTMKLIPSGLCPPLTILEESKKGWIMYRRSVPALDLTQLPEVQNGTEELIEAIVGQFSWFNNVRLDKN